MRKFLSLIVLLSVLTLIPTAFERCESAYLDSSLDTDDNLTYLIVGLDDAAKNTDAILLINYSASDNQLSFIQIPRDTYFNYSDGVEKINSVYPALINSGKTDFEAMMIFSREIEESLGIHIDGFSAYTTDAFVRMIDVLGGLEISLPKDFIIKDNNGNTVLNLVKGNNTLDGKTALTFVRHRASYLRADISRIDAQKLFISSLLKKFKSNLNLKLGLKMLSDSGEGIISNLDIGELLKIALKNKGRISSIQAKYATLPGEAVKNNKGIWYYSVSKVSSLELLEGLSFSFEKEFDKENKFYNSIEKEFQKIYNKHCKYFIYSDESLDEIEVK